VTRPARVSEEVVARLRSICLGLPEAYQESAWVGTRWRVRKRTFAHVLTVESGSPASYAQAVGSQGPVTVLTFRLPPAELDALSGLGYPYFRVRWGREVGGMALDTDVDWAEVAELLTESYCLMAPAKLADQVDRPSG
jgi:predicted DNA-binding protein (MmcQ/YjbR family)